MRTIWIRGVCALAILSPAQQLAAQQVVAQEAPECIAGEILKGLQKPHDCTVFGTRCTPEHPLGAPMVSAEGACAAYYQYGRGQ